MLAHSSHTSRGTFSFITRIPQNTRKPTKELLVLYLQFVAWGLDDAYPLHEPASSQSFFLFACLLIPLLPKTPSNPQLISPRTIIKVTQPSPPPCFSPFQCTIVLKAWCKRKGCLQITLKDPKPAKSEHSDDLKTPSKPLGGMSGCCLRGGLGVIPLHSTGAEH